MKWYLKHEIHGTKPWDVQAEAMQRSAGKDKYAYFLEQGLGKTPLTINDFLNYADVGHGLHGMLIPVPNSFKLDWPLAPEEWGVADQFDSVGYWPRDPVPWDSNRFLYAINYEAARDGRANRELLDFLDKRYVMSVFDESSSIKNPQSVTARAMIEFAKRSTMVRELNGTPIVQNVMDYYAQLRVLGELNGVNPFAFRNRFGVMGGYMGKVVVGMRNEEELYRILNRCSFRALKVDWRDLPPKVFTSVHLEMTKTQTKHYREMMEDFFTLVDDVEVSADMVLTQMDKLRQISSCLALQDGKAHRLEEPKNNPKVLAMFDLIADGLGKVIIVYFYRETGMMLYEAMQQAGLSPAWLRGRMEPEETIAQKKMFNDDSQCRVLVAQEEATSRGHTLLGGPGNDRCSRMIFFENSFSLLHRSQMEDRNHRGDQDQTCTYYDLVTSPMDGIVVNALVKKKAMAAAIDDVVKAVRSARHGRL